MSKETERFNESKEGSPESEIKKSTEGKQQRKKKDSKKSQGDNADFNERDIPQTDKDLEPIEQEFPIEGEGEEGSKEERDEKAVVIEAEAYKTIILYASRYANQSIPKEDWKEIYGVLIGHTDEDLVYVKRAEALTYGHATDVQLSDKHLSFIAEIEDKLYEEGSDQFIVGWFHSHPGLGLFYSYVDLINHIGFQGKNPDAIGLVFDHTLLGKKKMEEVEGTDHKITKYETGFEVYRMNDVNMDVDTPQFDENYHEVDYIVKGLNKFFFANMLNELSSLVSEGKPLQSAYREDFSLESDSHGERNSNDERLNKSTKTQSSPTNINPQHQSNEYNKFQLQDIPMHEEITFDGDELFYQPQNEQNQQIAESKQTAEQLVYEGNQALKTNDFFQGVEKYREAIKKLEEIGRYERVLELLKDVTEECISSNHVILADEFAEKMLNIATERNDLFYKGEAYYLQGYLLLNQNKKENVRDALNKIRDAAVIFNDIKDFVGAALSFHRIGVTFHKELQNYDMSVMFYREAIENYNEAIVKNHPLRKTLWSRKENLMQKVLNLRETVEELLPRVENSDIRERVMNFLRSINYNF